MPELHACYFCGELDDGLANHAVVPPKLDPDEDEQVTVALCPRCRRKFSRAVEPLVARAAETVPPGDAAAEGAASDAPSRESNGETPGDGADDGATDGRPDETPAGESTAEAIDPDEVTFTADAEGTTPGRTDESERDVGSIELDPESTPRGESNATPRGESDPTSGDEPTNPTPENASDSTPDERPDAALGSGTGAAGGDVPGAAADVPAGDAPAEGMSVDRATFRKVMRLLSNRPFPVERSSFESLASNAYDVGEGDVAAMIDAAVDQGLIGAENGQLVRD